MLAVVDFATQLVLVLARRGARLRPARSSRTTSTSASTPTWSQFFLAIPIAMIAYTGIETVSNLAEEARDPPRDIPRSISWVAIAVFAIYFTLPLDRALGDAGRERARQARPAAGAGRLQERPRPRARRQHGPARLRADGARSTTSGSSPRRSSSSRRTRASSARRGSRTRWRPTGSCRSASAGCTSGSRRRGSRSPCSRAGRRRSSSSRGSSATRPSEVDFLGNIYAFGAMLSFTVAHLAIIQLRRKHRDEELVFRSAAELADRDGRLAALRDLRRARDVQRVARRRRPAPGGALDRARVDRASASSSYILYRRKLGEPLDADGARAGRARRVARRSSTGTSSSR